MSDRVLPFSTAAQAYRATQTLQIRPVAHVRPIGRPAARDTLDLSAAARAHSQPTSKLAAARVPGQVSFDAPAPAQSRGALPIYAHPADRNAAATGVSAGRLIDTQG